jgi:hypothetical protein
MKFAVMLADLDNGCYSGRGQLSMTGTWTTTVTVTRPGQSPVTNRLSINAKSHALTSLQWLWGDSSAPGAPGYNVGELPASAAGRSARSHHLHTR